MRDDTPPREVREIKYRTWDWVWLVVVHPIAPGPVLDAVQHLLVLTGEVGGLVADGVGAG
jgi:hypothetical protein